jgi:serine/threonine-protein kinase
MIAYDRGRAVAKITDFGVAKVVADRTGLTRTGVVIGTPAYMAPEQFRSARDVDERADIFALGAILYELASGARALRGEDMISVHMAASRGDVAPLAQVAPGLPARWGEAVARALRPRPEDRPATVAELLAIWTGGQAPADAGWDEQILVRASRREEPTGGEAMSPALGSLSSLTDAAPGRARMLRTAAFLAVFCAGSVVAAFAFGAALLLS